MELLQELTDFAVRFIDVVLHLDAHLNEWALIFGPWLYVIVGVVVFCETGLIVTPILPGDSLLFALGAMTAVENAALDWPTLWVVLVSAAILGDLNNYSLGRRFGPKIFSSKKSRFFNRQHLEDARKFYETHGGKTVVLARYLPILRTFVPFVTGISQLPFRRYIVFNIVGAVSWVSIFLAMGRYFGNLPSVKSNFHYVIFGIVVVSALPAVYQFLRTRRKKTA